MWIPVAEKLPAFGQEVPVKGKYVPPNTGFPMARVCDCGYWLPCPHWHSREWRGTAGVTHWWEERKKRVSNKRATQL